MWNNRYDEWIRNEFEYWFRIFHWNVGKAYRVGLDFSCASTTGVQGKGCPLASLNCLNSCNASYMIDIMRILYYCVSWEILLCEHCLQAVQILLRESYQQVREILLLCEHCQWARHVITMECCLWVGKQILIQCECCLQVGEIMLLYEYVHPVNMTI
jgi:hypothetical protein